MPEEPDEKRQPNLELPQLRLPGFRGRRVRRTGPTTHQVRRSRTAPVLPGPLAAALTGLVVGALGVGLTYGGLRGCEALNGTPSCGGPGLGYLVAIAVGMVAVGALLLRALRVGEPVGTSFLAVGIIAVVVLVGLTGVIFSVWMFLAIPAVAAASYALARWVTTRFIDVEQPPGPDVR